jgi:glyoxylase-like metal-dependent hydrolase (beta-lactamase superfamily II)
MIELKVIVETIEKEDVKIYRMATLDNQNNPVIWVSAFVIDGLLIDCGHHHARKEFLSMLNMDEVKMAVLSHHHEDHFGAAKLLINEYNIPVYATKTTAFLIRPKILIPPERNLAWGTPEPCIVKELPNNKEINTSRGKFKIIPSPGHCKNLISFFQEERGYLFSTDAIADNKQTVLFNWENANVILKTLQGFKTLKPKYVFSSSGKVFSIKDLEFLIIFWTDIKQQSTDLYRDGVKLIQIVKEIFGSESWMKRSTGGDISRENLIRSLLELPPIFKRRAPKRRKKKRNS